MDDLDDINAPTVPSGSRSNGTYVDTSIPKTRDELLKLITQRDNLEEELKALGSVLDSHKVDMNTPLLTPDGFPRDDIDVAQIRITRSRIIHLKTDYKLLMSRIEKGLHLFHASLPADTPSSSTSSATRLATIRTAPETSTYAVPMAIPFATVNSVAPSSPAETAGLQVGDVVLSFGSVHGDGTRGPLSRLPGVVAAAEGQELQIRVQRSRRLNEVMELTENVTVTLVPRSGWGGRGLLGCHLVPI